VDHETQAFGLVAPGGVVSDTGVGGLTLGGGYGWVRRKYGLSVDALVEAQVVGADGEVRTLDRRRGRARIAAARRKGSRPATSPWRTASAEASGASCGRLSPMPPAIVLAEYARENLVVAGTRHGMVRHRHHPRRGTPSRDEVPVSPQPTSDARRRFLRTADVCEILEEGEISGLCWDRTSSCREPNAMASLAQ
jgi:hypothetical protein